MGRMRTGALGGLGAGAAPSPDARSGRSTRDGGTHIPSLASRERRDYSPKQSYTQSKLMNVLTARELARRWGGGVAAAAGAAGAAAAAASRHRPLAGPWLTATHRFPPLPRPRAEEGGWPLRAYSLHPGSVSTAFNQPLGLLAQAFHAACRLPAVRAMLGAAGRCGSGGGAVPRKGWLAVVPGNLCLQLWPGPLHLPWCRDQDCGAGSRHLCLRSACAGAG